VSEPADTGAIARISRAYRLLAEAKDLTDIKAVRDMAVAAAEYARAIKAGQETVNEAQEIVVRAERLAGLALKAGRKRTGGDAMRARYPEGSEVDAPPALADQGISFKQSAAWQDIAALPEADFEQEITERKEKRKPITTKALAKKGRERKKQEQAAKQPEPAGRPGSAAGQSVVNVQNIRDAHLVADFTKCMVSVAQIVAYAPDRIVDVLAVKRADEIEQRLESLVLWVERFKAAREAGSRPRMVVEG